MTKEQIQAAILSIVAGQFADYREATPRLDLIIKFEDSELLGDLLWRGIIRRTNSPDHEQYLPTAAAFEFCDNRSLAQSAREAVTVVLHTMRKMFLESSKPDFEVEKLLERVHTLFPDRIFDYETLKVGLYLVQDFGVMGGYRSEGEGTIDWFRIGEGIITMKNIDNAWETVTSRYKPMPKDRPSVDNGFATRSAKYSSLYLKICASA